MTLKIGDKVTTYVSVAGKRVPVRTGIIVDFVGEWKSLARVDIASLHGCSPWVVLEETAKLTKIES